MTARSKGAKSMEETKLLNKIIFPRTEKGMKPNRLRPQPMNRAQRALARKTVKVNRTQVRAVVGTGWSAEINSQILYGARPYKKLPMQPKRSPGPIPPKKSPITLPIAAPQAAAGPKRKEQITGTAFAGRNSVTPGMMGRTLKGMRIAAYREAQIAAKTTKRVLSHMRLSCPDLT